MDMPSLSLSTVPSSSTELESLLDSNEAVLFSGLEQQQRQFQWDDMLLSLHGAELPVRVHQSEGSFAYAVQRMTLDELCDALTAEQHEQLCVRHYLAGPNLLLHDDERVRHFARSVADAFPFVETQRLAEVGLWVGRHAQRTRMHFDVTHNLLHVVKGRKIVVLAHPKFYVNLYTHNSSDLVDNESLADSHMRRRMYRFRYESFVFKAADTFLITFSFFLKIAVLILAILITLSFQRLLVVNSELLL